ncbi:MAG: hypothetical protein HGA19_17385 [Oscillochloris sp.]|nr:hypothetical protein [Oscillochloris sp.]
MNGIAEITPADIVDGMLSAAEIDVWLEAHPELAEEVALARRVRALLIQLQAAEIPVPDGFERRVLARISADSTLIDLLDLCLSGVGRMILEAFTMLFTMLPASPRVHSAL